VETAVIYARVPTELKQEVEKFADSTNAQKTEAIVTLLKKGLDYSSIEEKSAQLQKRLADAQQAQAHLAGILNIEVGKCSKQGCRVPMTLQDFVFQRCQNGHFRTIELHNDFKKIPGTGEAIGEVVVAGLAIFGAVIAANQLLGGGGSNKQ
jgi:hypothetical protein